MGIMPALDHMLHYSHHGPVQSSLPYLSESHGRSERSEHSGALSSSPWLDACLSKDSAEASLLSSHLHPTLPALCIHSHLSTPCCLFLHPVAATQNWTASGQLSDIEDSGHASLAALVMLFSNTFPLLLPVYFVSAFEKAPDDPQSQCPGVCIYHFLLAELIQFYLIQAEQMAQSLRK